MLMTARIRHSTATGFSSLLLASFAACSPTPGERSRNDGSVDPPPRPTEGRYSEQQTDDAPEKLAHV